MAALQPPASRAINDPARGVGQGGGLMKSFRDVRPKRSGSYFVYYLIKKSMWIGLEEDEINMNGDRSRKW